MKLFKYGVISVPYGQMSLENFHISGEGLVGLDGESRTYSIKALEEPNV